ncbi:MAG: riboflavin kinase, archaea type [Archaeoglobaceae archaeon]|nr:riboflavin kinase, archaea type [Archaeoglobaceae archaeon]
MIEMLKALALMNASREVVKVSCKDLGEKLGHSTQTASRRLKELEDHGLIERTVTKNGQFIAITEKGMDMLFAEYSDYRKIFENANSIKLHCTVFSGLGEGSYYVSLEGYRRQFKEKLGIDPFPGTLNLRVAKEDLIIKKRLDKEEGIKIEGFSAENRTFGPAKAFKCKVNGYPAFIVIPQRTHYPGDVLEIISDKKLRDVLNLKDGDIVELEVIL